MIASNSISQIHIRSMLNSMWTSSERQDLTHRWYQPSCKLAQIWGILGIRMHVFYQRTN